MNSESQSKESKGKKKQLTWNAAMDAGLIEALVEAYRLGKKDGANWDESVWDVVKKTVYEKSHEHVERAHMTSRIRTMRKEYRSFVDLASKSGFGWDPIKQTVTASDSAWEQLLADPKSKETYGGFRYRRPKWDLEQLEIIIGNNHATGSYSFGGVVDCVNIDDVPALPVVNEDPNLDVIEESSRMSTVATKKRQSSSTEKQKYGKKIKNIDQVKDLIERLDSRLEGIQKVIDPATRASNVREEIMKTEGYNEDYLRDAWFFIMRDPIETQLFLAGDARDRKKLLDGLREKIGDI